MWRSRFDRNQFEGPAPNYLHSFQHWLNANKKHKYLKINERREGIVTNLLKMVESLLLLELEPEPAKIKRRKKQTVSATLTDSSTVKNLNILRLSDITLQRFSKFKNLKLQKPRYRYRFKVNTVKNCHTLHKTNK